MKATTKYLVWHSPRTGSNVLCNMLHQTGVAGIADYLNCGFPLGSIGVTKPHEFKSKLAQYEDTQTTPNGVFGCKLSWETLRKLSCQAGLTPVMDWLSTIDFHVYLYRDNTIQQAISYYIALERGYFSTTKTADILPNPEYDYHQIALHRRKIEMERVEMETYFDDYRIEPLRVCFEVMTSHSANLHSITRKIAERVSGETVDVSGIKPQIDRQINSLKQTFYDRFFIDWEGINE